MCPHTLDTRVETILRAHQRLLTGGPTNSLNPTEAATDLLTDLALYLLRHQTTILHALGNACLAYNAVHQIDHDIDVNAAICHLAECHASSPTQAPPTDWPAAPATSHG